MILSVSRRPSSFFNVGRLKLDARRMMTSPQIYAASDPWSVKPMAGVGFGDEPLELDSKTSQSHLHESIKSKDRRLFSSPPEVRHHGLRFHASFFSDMRDVDAQRIPICAIEFSQFAWVPQTSDEMVLLESSECLAVLVSNFLTAGKASTASSDLPCSARSCELLSSSSSCLHRYAAQQGRHVIMSSAAAI